MVVTNQSLIYSFFDCLAVSSNGENVDNVD